MREKGEILSEVLSNIYKAPVDTRCMLYHEYCFIEVLLDIRDILEQWMWLPSDKKEKSP